jgi:hypothetical protein
VNDSTDLADPTLLAGPPVTARVDCEVTDIELIRLIGRVLALEADKLGIDFRAYGFDLPTLARDVVNAARGGKLPAGEYRCVWQIAAALR